MPAGDILRRFAERQRDKWYEESRRHGVEKGRRQGREEGIEEGRRQGREEALREIYGPDYSNSQEGTYPQSPNGDNDNHPEGNNADR